MGNGTKDCFDKVESIFRILRDIAIAVVVGYVVYHLWGLIPNLVAQLRAAQINAVHLGIIDLTVGQIRAEQQLSQIAPRSGPVDTSASESAKAAVRRVENLARGSDSLRQVLKSITTATSPQPIEIQRLATSEFWVYCGAISKDGWLTKYFDITDVPKKDDEITAVADCYKRTSEPRYASGDWVLGDVVGILRQGARIRVLSAIRIPGTISRALWWVKAIEVE